MKLSYLMKTSSPVWHRIITPVTDPHADPEITSIHASAQEVKPGGLFIAIKGFKADGHDYIDQALDNGAVAIVTNGHVVRKGHVAVMAEVKDSRKAMSAISARFYGYPSNDMVVIGITGTNGKTTTAWILESILAQAGHTVGVIGTVNYRYKGQCFDNPITTPESIVLHKILAEMKQAGVTHVVMEVSSHAIDLDRVRDCSFDIAVFTNLTRDHLDYHKTMGAYFASKKRLFTRLLNRSTPSKTSSDAAHRGKGISVINLENAYGLKLLKAIPHDTAVTTSILPEAPDTPVAPKSSPPQSTLSASNVDDTISGLKGTLHFGDQSFSFQSKLTGRFNLENILSAAGAAHALGLDVQCIIHGIEACQGAPGRLERVENSGNRHIFVDYAHTPDALESTLKTLKMRAPARLITLFGCGGDRDATKRPLMGEIAARYSDMVIVTSDNPRTEAPDAIINDIMVGVDNVVNIGHISPPNATNNESLDMPLADNSFQIKEETSSSVEVIVEPERKKALILSIDRSKPHDIVVAAGKGHETYQVIHTGKIDFDDRLILHEACEKKFASKESSASPIHKPNAFLPPHPTPDLTPIPWSLQDVEHALYENTFCLETIEKKSGEIFFSGISTDSRTTRPDEIFVALQGEKFDGHNFIPDLLKRGVTGFIVSTQFDVPKIYTSSLSSSDQVDQLKVPEASGQAPSPSHPNPQFFPVENTLEALGKLARYQRLRADIKVVALTGSSGKTTTRQMISSIFEENFCTLSTKGNFNNEIGLPLTLLNLSKNHAWAVVEMGMNHPGEISRLSRIAQPDIALITNTAAAHLEGMGNVEGVARAKAEITEGMGPGSTLIVNGDDPRRQTLLEIAALNPNISRRWLFSTNEAACPSDRNKKRSSSADGMTNHLPQIKAEGVIFNDSCISFDLTCEQSSVRGKKELKEKITIHSPAPFMIHNALAAASAALAADIPIETIQKGLLNFVPVAGRMNIIHRDGVCLIDDTYNANPASVKGALETLRQMALKRAKKENQIENEDWPTIGPLETIAVLGDMLELGEESRKLHADVGKTAAASGISHLFCFGSEASKIVQGAIDAGFPSKKILHTSKDEITSRLLFLLNRKKESQNKEGQDKAKRNDTAFDSLHPPRNRPLNDGLCNKNLKTAAATHTAILIKGSRGMKMETILNNLLDTLATKTK